MLLRLLAFQGRAETGQSTFDPLFLAGVGLGRRGLGLLLGGLHLFFAFLAGGVGDDLAASGIEEPMTNHGLAEAAVRARNFFVLREADGAEVTLGRFVVVLDTHAVEAVGPPDPDHGQARGSGVVQQLPRHVVTFFHAPPHFVPDFVLRIVDLAVLGGDRECDAPRFLSLPCVEQVVEVEGEVPDGFAGEVHAAAEAFAEFRFRAGDEPPHVIEPVVGLPLGTHLQVRSDEGAELPAREVLLGGLVLVFGGHGVLQGWIWSGVNSAVSGGLVAYASRRSQLNVLL